MRPSDRHPEDRRVVARWLFFCAFLVFAMVVIGGITRLTESGLSMVEWQPVTGAIPPLSEADWQALFVKYQATPQYRQLNRGMSLEQFKTIFWWEYVHRLWGRMIGAVFALPFLWFLWRRRLDAPLARRCAGILALGGLQGAMGWYMVASGLVDRPEVSQYRLVVHLALALLIYALLLWQAMALSRPAEASPPHGPGLRRAASGLAALVVLTMLAGGFVAGLDAGLIYNTFPLMEGHLVPPAYHDLAPFWRNWFDNPAAVQFDHRVLAVTTFVAILLFVWRARTRLAPPARRAATALAHVAVLQVALGIATLLLVVPVPLAALHQAGAMAVFTAALWLRFALASAAEMRDSRS